MNEICCHEQIGVIRATLKLLFINIICLSKQYAMKIKKIYFLNIFSLSKKTCIISPKIHER